MLAELALLSADVYSFASSFKVAELCLLNKVTCCWIELIALFSESVCVLMKPVMLVPVDALLPEEPMALEVTLLRLVWSCEIRFSTAVGFFVKAEEKAVLLKVTAPELVTESPIAVALMPLACKELTALSSSFRRLVAEKFPSSGPDFAELEEFDADDVEPANFVSVVMAERAAFKPEATADILLARPEGEELTETTALPDPANEIVIPATALLSVLLVLVMGMPLRVSVASVADCASTSLPGAALL